MAWTFGNQLKLTLWGQSHAPYLGMVLEGLPAGFSVDLQVLQSFMDRRCAAAAYSTSRLEKDRLQVLAGLVRGCTCGAPLVMSLANEDARSEDYALLQDRPRPSHADYAAGVKYAQLNDKRGGGFFSGRMTAALCLAGGVALQYLESKGIRVGAFIQRIGTVQAAGYTNSSVTRLMLEEAHAEALAHHSLPVLCSADAQAMEALFLQARQNGDSLGGVVQCMAFDLPVGLGSPWFDSLESLISHLLFSIPGVKGVAFGSGFDLAAMNGSQANDAFCMEQNKVRTRTNHSGGINGGLSNGMPITLQVAFRPTPSIQMEQQTIDLQKGTEASICIEGRHDACYVPRAVPVVEAAVALVLADQLL